MTHDQSIASDPALSVWVAASAGTGKTKVLTDRVLRLLLKGANPARILCITFTRAAAGEMESRISEQLAGWAIAEEEALREQIAALTGTTPGEKTLRRARILFAEVLDTPERIRIQTIHSLCQSILARFPLEAGVPPHFTLIDETTSRELLAQAKAQLFINALNSSPYRGEARWGAGEDELVPVSPHPAPPPKGEGIAAAIAGLASHMGESTLDKLFGEIVQDRGRFEQWLPEPSHHIYAALGLTPEVTEETLLNKHFSYLPQEEAALKAACSALSGCMGKSDLETCGLLSTWLEKRDDPAAHARAFLTQAFEPRARLCTKEAEKILPGIKETLLAEQRRVIAWHQESRSLFVALMSLHVTELARALLQLYRDLKRRRGYLDYDDLIFHTARLLSEPGIAPWVLFKLDGGIDHLLIDEAQDTSPQQWRIAEALANEFFAGAGARELRRTLFVVGDEKQSIFSFQGAEPLEFDRMQRHLAKLAGGSGADFRRVRLALSFRSTAPVLEAVDSVFAREEARDGLIFSESDIRHDVHRKGSAGRVELWPLLEAPPEDELPSWHIAESSGFSARPDLLCATQVAETIARWLKEKRVLASQGRPVTPGDILILVQRRSAFASFLLRALKRRDVPVAGADRLKLTENIAVEDCVALADFLLLPQDDLMLAEVLRSPFIGISEEALFELAYNRGAKSLWQRVKESSKEAYEFLSDLLSVTDYLPPFELFTYILESKGGRRMLMQRLGTEIDDPLNEFLSLAMHYGSTHPPSLQGFLHWFAGGEIQIKRDMEKGRDEVRIMTVHGAKGLQAPIVFLPDTARIPPHEGGIFWTRDNNSVPLFSPGSDSSDRHYRQLRQSYRLDTEREYRRLLYVAMTRAEDELYILGWKSEKAVAGISWYELVRSAAEGWQEEGDKRVIVTGQQEQVKAKPPSEALLVARSLPDWAVSEAISEPVPTRPLSPSRLKPAPDGLSPFETAARARGILTHRLLQYLPEITPENRDSVIARFMQRYGKELNESEQEVIAKEVLAILAHPDFAPVFGPDSVAEVSITGIVGKITVAGRIDRLAVLPHATYIIDYKTNRKVPESEAFVPEAYLRQMEAYKQLVARIYPDKTVYCGLVFTAGPRLFILSDALLESLAA